MAILQRDLVDLPEPDTCGLLEQWTPLSVGVTVSVNVLTMWKTDSMVNLCVPEKGLVLMDGWKEGKKDLAVESKNNYAILLTTIDQNVKEKKVSLPNVWFSKGGDTMVGTR